ncbi:MAG: hypothetical protein AAGF31_00485 [Planctomycetota bacterium]
MAYDEQSQRRINQTVLISERSSRRNQPPGRRNWGSPMRLGGSGGFTLDSNFGVGVIAQETELAIPSGTTVGDDYYVAGGAGQGAFAPLVTLQQAQSIATANGWTYTPPAGASPESLVRVPTGPNSDDRELFGCISLHTVAPLLQGTLVVWFREDSTGPAYVLPFEAFWEMRAYDGYDGTDPKALTSTPGAGADGSPLWDRGECP